MVTVDDTHEQTQAPENIFMEDSIQVALDLDPEKPFASNMGGWNGHSRVYEFGAALKGTKALVHCWTSYNPSRPSQKIAAGVQALITRNGSTTTYSLTVPWDELGAENALAPGSTIGFSLVVNDKDGETGKRHGLTLFDGIALTKDPTLYGRLCLRPVSVGISDP